MSPAPWLDGALVLAQTQDPSGALLPLIYLLAFLGVFIFTFVGFLLFNEGWASYEEKYLEGAERTLDDLFLTIPAQQLLWLTLLCFGFGFVLGWMATTDLIMGLIVGIFGALSPRFAPPRPLSPWVSSSATPFWPRSSITCLLPPSSPR